MSHYNSLLQALGAAPQEVCLADVPANRFSEYVGKEARFINTGAWGAGWDTVRLEFLYVSNSYLHFKIIANTPPGWTQPEVNLMIGDAKHVMINE